MGKFKELKILATMIAIFLLAFFIPVNSDRFLNGIRESFNMLQEYAQLHVLFCLIPAIFIAGAVSVFISQGSVLKYLGASAKKWIAYTVASVSGVILAVCSCTILPLFGGIYKRGAGLGPAIAFLYAGPAINILAIIMTARILGLKLGIARAIGAIIFSVLIGLIMHFIFRKEENERQNAVKKDSSVSSDKKIWKTIIFFGIQVLFLIIINWAKPNSATQNTITTFIFVNKWLISGVLALILGLVLHLFYGLKLSRLIISVVVVSAIAFASTFIPEAHGFKQQMLPFISGIILLSSWLYFSEGELKEWLDSSWTFAKIIIPLLFIGVLIAGCLLGRGAPHEAWIPSQWVEYAVGGNSLVSNFFASIAGAFMYFATLTEVPILQGLTGIGMGQGPALALLLSGPALSLPSMLVINSVLGIKKTSVFVALVIIFSTISGYIYGFIA